MKQRFYKLGMLCTLGITVLGYAQEGKVGINTENPTATLQVKSKIGNDSSTKNLQLENANGNKLITVLDNGNMGIGTEVPTQKLEIIDGKIKITDGTQGVGKVLTSDANGVARWENISQNISNFNTISISTVVDPNILGYIPNSTATASSAPDRINIFRNSISAQKRNFITFNGHSYATYVADSPITWYDAYYTAKDMGGYLVTFTSDEEWLHIEAILLDDDRIFDTTEAWIGMARFEWYAGVGLQPNPEMKWITGEQPRHDYSAGENHAVRKVNWFTQIANGHSQNEPNNFNNKEGFVHTFAKNRGFIKKYGGFTSTHPWNDVQANNPSQTLKGFIVEFQQ